MEGITEMNSMVRKLESIEQMENMSSEGNTTDSEEQGGLLNGMPPAPPDEAEQVKIVRGNGRTNYTQYWSLVVNQN